MRSLSEGNAGARAAARWHEKGLEVVGISFDSDPQRAQAVINRMQFPWPSAAIAKDSAVDRLWTTRDKLTTLPTVLLVDQEGVLRYELNGTVTRSRRS